METVTVSKNDLALVTATIRWIDENAPIVRLEPDVWDAAIRLERAALGE